MPRTTTRSAELERVLRFLRRSAELMAEELVLIDVGVVLSTPTLPTWWHVNHVRIRQPVEFEQALALADEHLSALPFRHIVIEDDATGARLEQLFRAAGWKLERDLLMVVSGDLDRSPDPIAVIEPDEEQVVAAVRRWHLEEKPDASARELSQLERYARLEAHSLHEHQLGVESEDGKLAAITKLRWEGPIAQVEDVYTVPEARRRGYARALVSAALELAQERGQELTFIVADDEGWPKHLYRRMGFEPVGRMRSFHRDVG
jgi:ribosomal protein S18 acetylase RimI-like enzyme